jgi:Ca-activated chloride channel family protein
VGVLLDQIRLNGENKELVEEVTALAKKYGITTPYTSYLIVPDGPAPSAKAKGTGGGFGGHKQPVPQALRGGEGKDKKPKEVLELAKKDGDRGKQRDFYAERDLKDEAEKEKKTSDDKSGKGEDPKAYTKALNQKRAYDEARKHFGKGDKDRVQAGKLGVDLAVNTQNLRCQSRLDRAAVRNVSGRQCIEVSGVWIDESFTAKTEAVVVKAQSDAYFLLLEKHPELKKVYALGNYLVWLTPSGKALVIDANHGKTKLSDDEVAKLFAAKKK